MKIWVCDDEPSKRYPVYTRGNVCEVFVDVVSPLTWSLYGRYSLELGGRDALYEMGVFTPDEFKPEGECEEIGCFGGYVYINASVFRVIGARIPGLTPEAVDAAFFGEHIDVPPYQPDPRDPNPERTKAVTAWLASLLTTDPGPAMDESSSRLDAVIAKRPRLDSLSDAQLLLYFRSLIGDHRQLLKRHSLNTNACNVLTGIIAQACQAAGASALASKVTAAIGDVDSAGQAFELWNLSRLISASPELTDAFDQGVDGVLERLRASHHPAARRFCEQWDRFIDRWGFLGPSVWEFRSPTYRTHPELALSMLERLRRAPESSAPGLRAAHLIAQREAAIAELAGQLAEMTERRDQFLAAARSGSKYLAARERSKLQCTRMNEEVRAPLRELGERLVQRRLLPRWEDLLLITNDEAEGFVANPTAYATTVARRAAQLEVLQAKEPPFVFEGEPPSLSTYKDRDCITTRAASAGTQLRGIGVSPGRYTGRARIMTTIDAELEPGEVIVAAATDASWGPLFLVAGAVVAETGSVISHAAIVAREVGIPAAVSVTAATSRIADGAIITVDGGTGAVILH